MKSKLLIFIHLLFYLNSVLFQNKFTGIFEGIKDGDTIAVLDSPNYQTIFRLSEVNCPEKEQPFNIKEKQFTSVQIYRKQV